MHVELKQTETGKWQARIMFGRETWAGTGEYPTRAALDDDLARFEALVSGAARLPVVTVHEHGGQDALSGRDLSPHANRRADGAWHAADGSAEFATLADWLPQGE